MEDVLNEVVSSEDLKVNPGDKFHIADITFVPKSRVSCSNCPSSSAREAADNDVRWKVRLGLRRYPHSHIFCVIYFVRRFVPFLPTRYLDFPSREISADL